ncbi:MAG: glycosyl hydrolase [Actinoplanes sp.]
MLGLVALSVTAACGTNQPNTTEVAATANPLTPPTTPPTPAATARMGSATAITSPSASASASAAAKASASASPSATAARVASAGGKGGPVAFQSGRAMVGSYLSLGGKSLKQSLSLRRGQLGREQKIVHRFYPWDGYVPTSEPDVSKSSILMVSWHGAKYDQVNSGASDKNIASVAKKLKNMKRPILLRWGWEMNGDWFEWGGSPNGQDPAGYVKAWKRLHRIFRENGVTNVAWVWSPNWNSSPNVSWNKMQKYYPGDDYVDWVGVSGYDFYSESPTTLFNTVVKAYGKKKPIVLSETAAIDHGSGSKAAWIKKLSAYVKATPSIGAVVWFDTDIQDGSPHNFRLDSDSAALAAYKSMVQHSRFAG